MTTMYSKQDCIDALQRVAEIVGESPSRREFDSSDIGPSAKTIETRFGSWDSAKTEAGLELRTGNYIKLEKPDNRIWSDDEWKSLTSGRRREEQKKSYISEIKIQRGCSECGYDASPAALCFHHRDSDTKDMRESQSFHRLAWDDIDDEIDKCDVLCQNCHHVKHYDDGRYDI